MKIILALIKKETLQIIRDPSTILIAFILPLLMMLIYMYGINMDTPTVTVGVKIEDASPEIDGLVQSLSKSKYMTAYVYQDKDTMYRDLQESKLDGAIIIPNDFVRNLEQGTLGNLLVITDGSMVNSANYVQSYVNVAANTWLGASKFANSLKQPVVQCENRIWFNQDINSHYFILPGSLAVTLNLVGLLLTSLVVAREWERGTMEGLLGTHVNALQLVVGKYIPYFCLGIISLCFSVFLCIFAFDVPFYGSYLIVLGVSALFLLNAIGIGLLISTVLKNQFLACEASLGAGFMPALMLSGLMFPISSMPYIFQQLTRLLPPRYYVTFIESEFLAGTIPSVVATNAIYLSILSVLLFALVYKKTLTRLETGEGRAK